MRWFELSNALVNPKIMNDEKLDSDFDDIGSFILTDENISQEQINEMKMLGLDKPETVSYERWNRLQSIRYEHEFMIHLAATGMSQTAIAEAVGYDKAHVSKALNTPEIKERVRQEIEKIYGVDHKKALRDRSMKSLEVVDDILENGKESEKAAMAKWQLEHTIGKASQEIKVTKTTLTEFIVRVDQMKADQLRDVGPNTPQLSKPIDPFDTVIDQIIPKGMVIGKRSSGES